MITYVFACSRWRGWERKGCTATVLTSVQGGTWPLAVGVAGRWRWLGSKGRACSSTFFYLRLYFCPFRRDTVFVLQRASSRRTKGEMRKCAETLTSLFRNALISTVDRVALGREGKETKDISKVNGRDGGGNFKRVTHVLSKFRNLNFRNLNNRNSLRRNKNN